MNKFRRNKKVKDNDETEAFPSGFMGTSKSKKNKKGEVEAKPDFNLDNALPSTDNFRTSLLMPNLSARFSMLREQDDPTSKLGKANDDSVLFPKRASRLNLFGHNPSALADIAEVSSISGRSSFNMGRANSYASADEVTDDSLSTHGAIMNRKRPGEGNNLFGGRQKVYKIPVSNSGKDISGMRGKTVYEDDIHLSAFQKLRLREKEAKGQSEVTVDELQDLLTPEYEDGPAFLAKRTTSSSTTSGHSNPRTSTAATSIDEQPISTNPVSSTNTPTSPNKSSWVPPNMLGHVSKTRRLYGQSLAQTAQDQQSSTLTRLESLNRQGSRAGTPELPRLNRTFSRSATNLNERRHGLSPVNQQSSGFRTYSPVTSSNSPQFETADAQQQQDRMSGSSGISPSGYGVVPPLSPPVSDNEEVSALVAHLQPEDRGKATAMGLFNKPTGPFDEQQFMRRQLQMHEGRSTPPVPPTRQSSSNSISKPDAAAARSRGLSNASYRSKAESASSRYSDDRPNSRAHSIRDMSPTRPGHGTFLADLNASDSEGQAGDEPPLRKVSSVKSQAFDGIHPAFRSRPASRDSEVAYPSHESPDIPEFKYSDHRDLNPIQENQTSPPSPILEEASERAQDSPTLGPTGLGLSSMIRTHLRHDSTQSSIYPLPSPRLPTQQDITALNLDEDSSKTSFLNVHGNPSENNDLVHQEATNLKAPSHPPPTLPSSGFSSVALRAKQLRDQAAALREQNNQSQADQYSQPGATFQQNSNFGHRRGSSTETQKEREEFAHELAERRRRVQENLHRIDSRSSSPAPGRQTPDAGSIRASNAFSVLKNRATKNVPQDRGAPTPKALKKLGIGSAAMNSSTPSLDSWRDDEMPPSLGKHSNSSSPQIGSVRHAPQRRAPSRSTSHGSEEDLNDPASSRTASPTRLPRDRSTSASGRSKSRPRPRDDLGIVAEDSISRYDQEDARVRGSPSVPSSTRPSVDINDQSNSPGGMVRTAPGHLEISPSQINPNNIGASPRPSPIAPYSANATPPLDELDSQIMGMSQASAMYNIPQRSPGSNSLQKRQVDKSQISEPTFVSSTSNVPIVDLPPGASLSNGMETPPVPPMNPRRRRTTATQTILGAVKGDKPQMPGAKSSQDERSAMSFDDERRQNTQQRLRKMSSEGVNLYSRSRQQAMMGPAPAMPNYPPPTSVEGGMI